MKRKFNYTGRERIKRKRISFSVVRENETITSFILDRLDLDDLTLPENAKLYAEAYHRAELKRFDCGTCGNPRIPLAGDLRDLSYPNLKFRILAVNTADGKILAHADRISPEAPAEKKSILPVDLSRDLGNTVWRIEYVGDEGSPILYINRRIPNIENIARADPEFFINVYFAVIREILTHMVFLEGVDSVSDPGIDWHADWLKYTRHTGLNPPDSLNPEDENNFDKYAAVEWINDAVETFCNQHAERFQEYIRKLKEV